MKLKSKKKSVAFTVDIEVEDTHTYQLENGIISHNTVSLLAGATPGMHYPESRFYIRRVRLSKFSHLIKALKKAGYLIEPANKDPENTVVVEFPVDFGKGVRSVKEVSMWEQLSLAAFLQKYWADNQVSCTVTFDPEKEGDQIKHALNYFQYQLKGISFLPRKEQGAYPQMPYEAITEEEYQKIVCDLKPVKYEKIKNEQVEIEKFCDGDSCQIKFAPVKENELTEIKENLTTIMAKHDFIPLPKDS